LPSAWVFDHPFFIILNLAIGGNWPGSPDATTDFPARMLVDWVRVYRDSTLQPPPGLPLEASALKMSIASNGPNWQAIATVTVTDGKGIAQSGVTVLGAWSRLINVGVTQATTDSNGVAVLSSDRVRQRGTISFCVTNLVKSGYNYSPSGRDCGQITR
jgi:beta-glucanase (GH16 family)